jgi:hypothetical protein
MPAEYETKLKYCNKASETGISSNFSMLAAARLPRLPTVIGDFAAAWNAKPRDCSTAEYLSKLERHRVALLDLLSHRDSTCTSRLRTSFPVSQTCRVSYERSRKLLEALELVITWHSPDWLARRMIAQINSADEHPLHWLSSRPITNVGRNGLRSACSMCSTSRPKHWNDAFASSLTANMQ